MFSATVFYAWQSDRPDKTNRRLIREAAEAACLRITEDETFPWSLTLDSDTQGRMGMCDIPNTILEKIEDCDIFLADLTLVAATEADAKGKKKQMPNANVMFELGFAAGKHGFDSMVGVMNEAFGSIDGQAFDVKRREALKYCVSAEASSDERRKAKESLSKRLEEVFRETLSMVVHERRKEIGQRAEEVFSALREQCASRILSGEFHDVKDLPVVLLSVRPREPHAVEVDSVLGQLPTGLNPRVMGETIVWRQYATTVEFDAENAILFHVFIGDYLSVQNWHKHTMHSRLNESDDVPKMLRGCWLQHNVVKHISESCHVLNSIGVGPPWDVGVSVLGGEGFELIMNDNSSSRESLKSSELHLPTAVVPTQDSVADEATTGASLRKTLNRLVRQFGEEHNPCFDSEGNWRVQE